MRCFGFHTVPELSCSLDWWLGCCWTVWTRTYPQVSPAFRAAPSFSGRQWLCVVTTWAHEMDGAGCDASSKAQNWPRRSAWGNLQRGLSEMPDRDMSIVWTRGRKEVNHLGVILDSSNVLPCCFPQWSNGKSWWPLYFLPSTYSKESFSSSAFSGGVVWPLIHLVWQLGCAVSAWRSLPWCKGHLRV